MGVVRIPIATGEIQGMGKKAADPIVLAHEDGAGAKEYANDGTYVMPRRVCADTGSTVWCPVDVTTGHSVQIRRIDLSNELLRGCLETRSKERRVGKERVGKSRSSGS